MRDVTIVPYDMGIHPRVESGALRLGDDWAGLFLRGDEAVHLAHSITVILTHLGDESVQRSATLAIACDDLRSVRELILRHVAR